MRAMILAAGLGSRLLPLTRNWPKCLMPVANTPLLELALRRLAALRVKEAVINTHYLASLVHEYVYTCPLDINFHISHEPRLLGTGGALVKARAMLGSAPFWLMNADVCCDADLTGMPELMQRHNAIACLGLVDEPRFNSVAIDEAGRLMGVQGHVSLPAGHKLHTYSGLALIHPRLLDYLPARGPSSLVDAWHAALRHNETIVGVELSGQWNDLGTWRDLWQVNARQAESEMVLLAANAEIAGNARIHGFCFMGLNSRIEAGATVVDSILLPGAIVAGRAKAEKAIIGKDAILYGSVHNGVFA